MPTCICAVVGCSNNTYHLRNWKADFCKLHNCNFGTRICICNPPFILFPFPTEKKDQERRQRWIKNINRKDPNTGKLWNPTYNDRVCSIHFINGKPTKENPDPCLHMGHDSTTLHKKPRPHVIRGEPVIKKRKLSKVTISSEPTTSESFDNESISSSQYIYTAEAIHNESVLTEHSYALGTDVLDIVKDDSTNNENKNEQTSNLTYMVYQLKHRIVELERQLQISKNTKKHHRIGYDQILKNDKKIKYYTGLPSREVFNLLYDYVHPKVEKMAYWRGTKHVIGSKRIRKFIKSPKKFGPSRKLSIKDELLMVLMKLRLGLMNEDLSDRFGTTTSVVSSIFNTWIKVLAKCLRGMIHYPDKISARENLPDCFKNSYPNLRCTIDCTEFFIERPRDLSLQALTWSDYKKHNTAKVLIGISPRGSISFVSKAWG